MKRILGGTGAAIAAKVVTGLAIGALAAAGATAVTEAAITGSANPNDWGQQVVAQVQKCKDALTAGQHGIGQCVSAFAKQHGPLVSGHASDARSGNGNSNSNGNGHSNGNGNGNGHGKPANPGSQGTGPGQPGDKSHPRPTPTSEPGS